MDDLNLWLKWSKITTYADDTSTSVSGKTLTEIINKLEEDAIQVLKYMASNGLVANATKTALLFLNVKQDLPIEIKIGDSTVSREASAKLLGMNVTDDLKWNHHTNVTTAALNKRHYPISRLKCNCLE